MIDVMSPADQPDEARANVEWRALRDLAPHLWPSDNVGARLRVVLALALLSAAKVATVYVPILLKKLVDLFADPANLPVVVPLGLVGAIFFANLRGLENDVFLQIGLLTTMGLASKNAILMIEFAEQEEKKGARVIDAVLRAARIRLRPILMTSFAFIFGVLPLALSTGPGANSRIAIGTSVIGGMLTASLLAIFYIPLLFVLVRRGTRDGLKALHARFSRRAEPEAAA